MRSATPKHLHPLLGRRLVDWTIEAARALAPSRLVVVASPETRDAYDGVEVAVQENARGSGDAVASARSTLAEFDGDVVVLADTPLLTGELLEGLLGEHRREQAAVTILSWNPASERITGYPAERVLGSDLDVVAGLLDADRTAFTAIAEDEVHSVRVRSAGGETRWLAISRAPLPEGGSVIVLRDETTRRQVEEILAREDRERLKSDLVATVSHELRTPLTSILGFTKTLLRGHADEREQRQYLEIIEKQGERLKNLIDDLLDARQISEGRLALNRARVDVRDVVAEQADMFSRQSATHVVVADVPPDPLWVDGDRDRLGPVLLTLL